MISAFLLFYVVTYVILLQSKAAVRVLTLTPALRAIWYLRFCYFKMLHILYCYRKGVGVLHRLLRATHALLFGVLDHNGPVTRDEVACTTSARGAARRHFLVLYGKVFAKQRPARPASTVALSHVHRKSRAQRFRQERFVLGVDAPEPPVFWTTW